MGSVTLMMERSFVTKDSSQPWMVFNPGSGSELVRRAGNKYLCNGLFFVPVRCILAVSELGPLYPW